MITSRLRISDSALGGYELSVEETGGGEPKPISSSLIASPLPPFAEAPDADILVSLRNLTTSPDDPAVTASAAGRYLFNLLAANGLKEWLDTCRTSEAGSRRTVLAIDSPELQRLPWEMMLDTTTHWAPFLSPANAWAREGGWRFEEQILIPPVRVLFVAGSPDDVDLYADDELDALTRAVCRDPGGWHLESLIAPIREDFDSFLEDFEPHVLHLVAHGRLTRDGEHILALREGHSQAWDLTPFMIANRPADAPRLVVLNSCRSGVAPDREAGWNFSEHFLDRRASAVVAMQGDISAQAGVDFTEAFYRALVSGQSVDIAAARGRNAVARSDESPAAWGLPMLMLAGDPAGVLSVAVRDPHPKPVEFVELVTQFVDRAQERRTLWTRVAPEPPGDLHHLVVVTGPKDVGKSAVVRGALPACYARGCDIAYVDFRSDRRLGWFGAVRRILQDLREWLPEMTPALDDFAHVVESYRRGPVELSRQGGLLPLDGVANFENEADCGETRKKAIFRELRRLIRNCGERHRLVLVLDHLATGLSNEAFSDFIVPRLVQPLIKNDESSVVLVLVLPSAEELAELLPAAVRLDPIVVPLFESRDIALLLHEYFARNHPDTRHAIDNQFAKALADQKPRWFPKDLSSVGLAIRA